jgi:hypothetical protein
MARTRTRATHEEEASPDAWIGWRPREQPTPHSRLEISHRVRAMSQFVKGLSNSRHARSRSRARSPRSRQQRPRARDEGAGPRWLPPHAHGARSRDSRSTQAERIKRSRFPLPMATWRQLRGRGDQLRSWWRHGSAYFLQPSVSIACPASTRAGQMFCTSAERSTNEASRSDCAIERSAGGASVFSTRRSASTDFEARARSTSAIPSRGRARFSDGTTSFSDGTAR